MAVLKRAMARPAKPSSPGNETWNLPFPHRPKDEEDFMQKYGQKSPQCGHSPDERSRCRWRGAFGKGTRGWLALRDNIKVCEKIRVLSISCSIVHSLLMKFLIINNFVWIVRMTMSKGLVRKKMGTWNSKTCSLQWKCHPFFSSKIPVLISRTIGCHLINSIGVKS